MDEGEHVRTVVFDPTGQLVVSIGLEGILRIWNLQTAAVTDIDWHLRLGISQLAYSPDGSKLLACGVTDTVYMWDVVCSELRYRLGGHAGWVQSVAWLPDGTAFVSASHDGTLRVWDARSGACLQILRVPGPYAGMNIAGALGITAAQRMALKALGAVDELSS
jgi:WD40 repeat protein